MPQHEITVTVRQEKGHIVNHVIDDMAEDMMRPASVLADYKIDLSQLHVYGRVECDEPAVTMDRLIELVEAEMRRAPKALKPEKVDEGTLNRLMLGAGDGAET